MDVGLYIIVFKYGLSIYFSSARGGKDGITCYLTLFWDSSVERHQSHPKGGDSGEWENPTPPQHRPPPSHTRDFMDLIIINLNTTQNAEMKRDFIRCDKM